MSIHEIAHRALWLHSSSVTASSGLTFCSKCAVSKWQKVDQDSTAGLPSLAVIDQSVLDWV